MNSCSYCGIKLARGYIKSKPIERIINGIEQGLQKGFKKFSLIGTDLGSYGKDLGCDLIDLCREIPSQTNGFEVKLRNIHPGYLIQNISEFLDVLSRTNITYLSSAIQSGSDRVLSLMRRNYSIHDCLNAFNTLRRESPQLRLRTQLMVGFPTETEDDFRETIRILDETKFDYVEVYLFEPRPGTAAAEMEGQIPHEIALNRCYKLNKKTLFL